MTYEDILKIKHGLDEAQKTDEPFVMAEQGEKLRVFGNVNKTKVNKFDYKLTFETDDGETVTKVYKDVFITPRKRLNVVRLMVQMLPYFEKPNADGSVGEYTDIETAELFLSMEDAVYDAMYDLAVEVLDVPKELRDYILPVSALAFGVKLIMDHPAVIREAEMSFG